MTTTQIPGSIFVEINPSEIPAGPKGDQGPPGAGIVAQKVTARILPGGTTTNSEWVTTGFGINVTPGSVTNEIHLEASGRVGHDSSGTIIYFTWFRDGVELTPAGLVALDSPRVSTVDNAERFDCGTLVDVPGVTTQVSYVLMWKTIGGTAIIGQRHNNGLMSVGGSIVATEYLA